MPLNVIGPITYDQAANLLRSGQKDIMAMVYPKNDEKYCFAFDIIHDSEIMTCNSFKFSYVIDNMQNGPFKIEFQRFNGWFHKVNTY